MVTGTLVEYPEVGVGSIQTKASWRFRFREGFPKVLWSFWMAESTLAIKPANSDALGMSCRSLNSNKGADRRGL